MQVYREVLEWDPPIPGARCMLEFGDTTLITQVPQPSTLPPPAPPDAPQPFADLQLLPPGTDDNDTLHAAFYEVDIVAICGITASAVR